jgi:hypothetical protein
MPNDLTAGVKTMVGTTLLVCSVILSACARPAKADETSTKLLERVAAGKCSDTSGLPVSATTNWTAICTELGSYLPPKFAVPSFATSSQQAGETGWIYRSTTAFTNNAGYTQELTFTYEGTGTLSNKPAIAGVTSVITADLVAESITTLGGRSDVSPGAEEIQLVESIELLLRSQQCEQVQNKAFEPFTSPQGTSFGETCGQIDTLTKERYVPGTAVYKELDLRASSVSPSSSVKGNQPVPTRRATRIITAYLQEFDLELALVNNRWYLNAIHFERDLFTYKL